MTAGHQARLSAQLTLPAEAEAGMRLFQQQRGGPGTIIELRFVQLGIMGNEQILLNGEEPARRLIPPMNPSPTATFDVRAEAYHRFGLAWSQVTLTVRGKGEVSWQIDWDGPPSIPLPTPMFGGYESPEAIAGCAVQDLYYLPRPPERVPVWMKAWLATQGGWDLETDQPSYTLDEFTGTPIPYEQAYQVLHAKNPSVIPHALASDLPTSSATTASYPTTNSTSPDTSPNTDAPAGTTSTAWPPPTGAPVLTTPPATPPWPTPTRPLDPAPFRRLHQRWARLAQRYPGVITLLPPPTPHQLNHLAPPARDAATALPGATIGDLLTLTWHPSTPTTGQILHTDQDLTIAAPLTPTGNLDGLVAATREGDDTPGPIPATVLQYWTTLTDTAEQAAPELAAFAADETDDPEEITLTHTELLADTLTHHLDALTRADAAGSADG